MPKLRSTQEQQRINNFRKVVKGNMEKVGLRYQKDLAVRVGEKEETWNRYMNHPGLIRYRTLIKLSDALKLSEEEKRMIL